MSEIIVTDKFNRSYTREQLMRFEKQRLIMLLDWYGYERVDSKTYKLTKSQIIDLLEKQVKGE